MSDEDGAWDAIDVILEQWRRERPDLDLSPMGVFGRLAQVARVVEASVDEVFTRHGLRPESSTCWRRCAGPGRRTR